MLQKTFFKLYFWIIGIYDVLLGGAFALFYRNIFSYFNITLPNHPGYIHIPALFLVSAGIGELLIARDLVKNVDLAVVRMLMKLSFAGAIIYGYFRYGVPSIFLMISVASVIGIIINILFIRWAVSASAASR